MSHDALAVLQAKQAITEQLFNYCRSMDRIDNELGKAVWHPGGTADFGELYRGSGEGWIKHVSVIHATTCLTHSHMLGNIAIRVSGETASSECYVHAILQSADGQKRIQRDIRGRYLDRWSERQGRWAIDHRQLVIDLSATGEVTGDGFMFQPWGRRDTNDPSYVYI